MMRWLPLALLACLAAQEPVWDHLPTAIMAGDDLHLAWRGRGTTAQWRDSSERAVPVLERDGGERCVLTRPAAGSAVLAGPTASAAVVLLPPGQGRGLRLDEHGRLRRDGAAVVLLGPPAGTGEDRRWQWLRALGGSSALLPVTVLPPAPSPWWGGSPWLNQVVAAQSVATTGQRIVVLLDPSERLAGWTRRDWTAVLGWLLADLAARGAQVTVVQPPAPQLERDLVLPLWEGTRSLAELGGLRIVETAALADDDLWRHGGAIGPGFNAQGRERLLAFLAGHGVAADRLPAHW
jgi:hypothetical protein